MFTAIVLNPEQRNLLLANLGDCAPPWWAFIADHLTINMGSAADGPCAGRLGEEVELKVVAFAINDQVAAVKVETDIPSTNTTKHITIAVDVDNGAKPVYSNQIEDWKPIPEFVLRGKIAEM